VACGRGRGAHPRPSATRLPPDSDGNAANSQTPSPSFVTSRRRQDSTPTQRRARPSPPRPPPQVRAACRKVLPALDLDTTTERMVREIVSKELGNLPVEAHKRIIKVGPPREGEGAGQAPQRGRPLPPRRGAAAGQGPPQRGRAQHIQRTMREQQGRQRGGRSCGAAPYPRCRGLWQSACRRFGPTGPRPSLSRIQRHHSYSAFSGRAAGTAGGG
jgi:hypothetical protein